MIDVLQALDHISPDLPRSDWFRVLAAVKSELGDAGEDIARDWSIAGETYREADFNSTWKSTKVNGGITVGTLVHMAQQSGWKPEKVAPHNNIVRLNQVTKPRQQDDTKQEVVALECDDRWELAELATGDHPYLQQKAVPPLGIRQEGENLLIPMRDKHGRIWSLQTITPDGKKLFAKGSRTKGMYHRIKGEGPVVICEGYATGASIYEATGYNVAITFSCGNLEPVARRIREKLPGGHIIVAADSAPESTTEKARAVAQVIGADLAIPSEKDFNDLAEAEGYVAVRAQIDGAKNVERSYTQLTPKPEPLPPALESVDEFDERLLPESIRPWIMDVSERIQCPPDFPAIGAMVSLANTLGRKIAVRPKEYDDWMEVPNLWGAVVGRPGIMKSPALAESMRPLNRLAMEAQETHKKAVEEAEAGEELRKANIAALRAELKGAFKGESKKSPDAIAEEMEALKEKAELEPCKRYKVNDATVEKLGELLAENPNGLLVFRDELVGWLRQLDRDGAENARPFYLESWNGMGSYTYDRIGRGTLHIDHACLGVLGGIQPGPLSVYVRGAIKNGQGADGLLQRIQMLVWPDDSGGWKDIDRYPDTGARDTAYEVFQRFSQLAPSDANARKDDFSPQHWLRFDSEAQELFGHWRHELENTKLRAGEHEAIESHLSKYRKLVPALALVIHLTDIGAGSITRQSLEKACAWGEYLESHARRVYGAGTAPDLPAAHALLKKIEQGKVQQVFKPKDIYHKGWAGLDKDSVYKAVDVLAEYGRLVMEEVPTGGRPSTICRVVGGIKI